MRRPIIAGNWKMNKTIKEAIELINGLKRELVDIEEVEIVVTPPYTALSEAGDLLIDSSIKLGAQNIYWENKGAFTGEVSARMLKDVGCTYVIIGHSERRKYFFETDESVHKKIKAALENMLTPIVCIGETLEEREKNLTMEIVKKQLKGAFGNLSEDEMKRLVIAYEPVWAIGTGRTATPQQAQEVHHCIRKWIEDNFSSSSAKGLRILYGGSVKSSNARELMNEVDIDGALVGGASLDVGSFVEIVKNSR